jgi:hypothetical protein
MTHEIPANQVPTPQEIEDVLREDPTDPRDENGTGEEADEQQLGVSDEEVKDLANDAEGG